MSIGPCWLARRWLDNASVIIPRMTAARLLRQARRRAGMTQRELARAADTPQPAIARIESGAVEPRLATLQRLLAAAGSQLEAMPALGSGVDRSLIRAALSRSPEERIVRAGREGRNLARLLDEVGRGRQG